jgi:hypothetical protein
MNEKKKNAHDCGNIEKADRAGEPLQLFTIPITPLFDLFHEFDKAMEAREIL